MRHVEPQGEYVIEQRRVRFKASPPWPLPGDTVMLVCAKDIHGIMVQVDDMGDDGCVSGTVLGFGQGEGLGRIREPTGYDS